MANYGLLIFYSFALLFSSSAIAEDAISTSNTSVFLGVQNFWLVIGVVGLLILQSMFLIVMNGRSQRKGSVIGELNDERDQLQDLIRVQTQELEVVSDQLNRINRIDQLTQLPNRRFFEETLELECNRAKRYNDSLSLLLIELDQYEYIVEQQGKAYAQSIIAAIGNNLGQTGKRATDLTARIDECRFAIILPYTDSLGAVVVAKNIRERVGRIAEEFPDSTKLISIALGAVSVSIWAEFQSPWQLLKDAEEQLRISYSGGSDHIKIATI